MSKHELSTQHFLKQSYTETVFSNKKTDSVVAQFKRNSRWLMVVATYLLYKREGVLIFSCLGKNLSVFSILPNYSTKLEHFTNFTWILYVYVKV